MAPSSYLRDQYQLLLLLSNRTKCTSKIAVLCVSMLWQVESAAPAKSRYRCCCRITRRTTTMLRPPTTLPPTALHRLLPRCRRRATRLVELNRPTLRDLPPLRNHDVGLRPAPPPTTRLQRPAPSLSVRQSCSLDLRTATTNNRPNYGGPNLLHGTSMVTT